MRRGLFLGLLALSAARPAWAAGLTPTAAPLTSTPAAKALSRTPTVPSSLIYRAKQGLDAELGLLSGGPLNQALEKSARKGLRLRLVLDPTHLQTREQGLALARLSPAVQVRWKDAAGSPRRWLNLDKAHAYNWAPGEGPHPCAQSAVFEAHWAQARSDLSEAQKLDDQLQGLPDPREKAPHYKKRRSGAAP